MDINNIKTLEQFEESGLEVYQVTQNKWIEIHNNHMLNWINQINKTLSENEKIKDIENRLYANKIEAQCFHESNVFRALKDNKVVSEEVLKDYPQIIEEVKREIKAEEQKQRCIESVPIFTQETFNSLNVNDKIKIGTQKVTVYKKENNDMICRLYKCRNKGIALTVGERYNISIGW